MRQDTAPLESAYPGPVSFARHARTARELSLIRLPEDLPTLRAPERFGLTLLLDLARLVPVETGEAVDLRVADGPEASLQTWAQGKWGIEPRDGAVHVTRQTLGLVTAVAGAEAEQQSTAADRHGRVPSADNPLVAAGLERRPIVSEAATALRAATRQAAGRRPVWVAVPWPEGKRWAAALTHDLDVVSWWPAFTTLRLVELLRKGEFRRLGQVLGAAVSQGRAPVAAGVSGLLAAEHAHRVRSTWFVLSGKPTWATVRRGDLTYRPAAAAPLLARIRAAGNELGLHGSFETVDHHEAFARQRDQLVATAGAPVAGVRQHYVKMRPGATHRGMAAARFAYDATYGFPDRNGYRLGVADVAPAWDAAGQRPQGIELVPLVWMDRALSKYRGVEDPAAWVRDGLDLARRAAEVEGLWVGLWHPNLTPALGYPGAPPAYAALLEELVSGDPYVAPLGEIVAWRRSRRAARIRGIEPDGRPDLSQPPGARHPVRLERLA